MWQNMKCLCAIHVDRNQQTFLEQMMSFVVWYDVIYHSLPIISQYLMMWGGGGGGGDSPPPVTCKWLPTRKVCSCRMSSNWRVWLQMIFCSSLLGIAHAWKWQIALLPKQILIKKQTQWSHVSCRSVSRRSIIFVPPTETSEYFSITKFNNK